FRRCAPLRHLGTVRPKDVPPIDVILVESPQPNAPYGIKGVGEIGLVPTAGAVAAALQDLDGDWRNALPMGRTRAGHVPADGERRLGLRAPPPLLRARARHARAVPPTDDVPRHPRVDL